MIGKAKIGIMIFDTQTTTYDWGSIKRLKIEPPFPDIDISDVCVFGYDPGTTRMGIASIWNGTVTINEIKAVRSADPVERIMLNQNIMSHCVSLFTYHCTMVIEGSGFSKGFRQTELAEVRASAALWAIKFELTPIIVNPLTIRKVVFGSGKTRAEEVWSDLPPNAASALACAYYCLMKKSK